jgi:hypothetical protein
MYLDSGEGKQHEIGENYKKRSTITATQHKE